MTLQVAMIASGGWLLASDVAGAEPQPTSIDGQRPTGAPIVPFAEGKIARIEKHSIIYAFAGAGSTKAAGLLMGEVADADPALLSDRNNFLRKVKERADQRYGHPLNPVPGTLTVFFLAPKVELWTLHLERCNIIGPRIDPPFSMAGAGNWAMFFPCRYYEQRALADLKLLAAHTILTGNHFNRTGVAGLELWSAGNGEPPQKAEEPEIQKLKERSAALSERLRATIFS
jgi:hypothetical protein